MNNAQWGALARKELKDRTIVAVRYMTKAEAKASGWSQRPLLLTLDDGKVLCPMADDEGNGGGALAVMGKQGEVPTFPVLGCDDPYRAYND
jgi:hypothetical protein